MMLEADAYRTERDEILAEYDYTARISNDETGTYSSAIPSKGDDGVIRPERVDDIDRGVEIRLSGPGDPDEWAEIDAANRAVVEAVTEAHGETHGANAALASLWSNACAIRCWWTPRRVSRSFETIARKRAVGSDGGSPRPSPVEEAGRSAHDGVNRRVHLPVSSICLLLRSG